MVVHCRSNPRFPDGIWCWTFFSCTDLPSVCFLWQGVCLFRSSARFSPSLLRFKGRLCILEDIPLSEVAFEIFCPSLWLVPSFTRLAPLSMTSCLDRQRGVVRKHSDSGGVCPSLSPAFVPCSGSVPLSAPLNTYLWNGNNDIATLQSCHEALEPSSHGVRKHCINSRHIIDDFVVCVHNVDPVTDFVLPSTAHSIWVTLTSVSSSRSFSFCFYLPKSFPPNILGAHSIISPAGRLVVFEMN